MLYVVLLYIIIFRLYDTSAADFWKSNELVLTQNVEIHLRIGVVLLYEIDINVANVWSKYERKECKVNFSHSLFIYLNICGIETRSQNHFKGFLY